MSASDDQAGTPELSDLPAAFTPTGPATNGIKMPPQFESGDIDIIVDSDTGLTTKYSDGALVQDLPDGGALIDLDPKSPDNPYTGTFDENLAEILPDSVLQQLTGELMQAIESDDRSRQEWLQIRASNIDALGLKAADASRGDAGASSAPVEGMSTVVNPLMLKAVIQFQSNASAELYPAGGPVKATSMAPPEPEGADETPVMFGHNGGPPLDDPSGMPMTALDALYESLVPVSPPIVTPIQGTDKDDLAQALEDDMNYYLTKTDKGYRADSVRMLFWVGFGGCGFKKVYNCPIRRMPISRSIDAANLIVANAANDIDDAGRITEVVPMRRSTYVRMQLAGIYRKMGLPGMAVYVSDPVREKIAELQGLSEQPQRPEDIDFTIYESYCEMDIPGFEHKDVDGEITGLQLPYKVSIDKDKRQILEIRRNWEEDDENYQANQVYVKFSFLPAMGFYDIGLSQILANTNKALTGVWRLLLDAGMFASFPGFLYSDAGGRQVTSEFRVPPGGGVKIQTGGMPIDQVVAPLPYKDPSQTLVALGEAIQGIGEGLGGIADIQVGEGRADAPVGTTLALIEQATKMLSAVHINLHAAQSEEFQLLKARFKDDPESFWRRNKRPARKWQVQEFLAALDDCDIIPAADPNTASQLQRVMKAVAVKQLQAATPWLYDPEKVDSRILKQIGIDPASVIIPGAKPPPPQPPPGPQMPPPDQPDPSKMAAVQLKAQQDEQDAQLKLQEMQQEAGLKQAELASQDRARQSQTAQQAAETQSDAQIRAQEAAVESADRAADRASHERIAAMRENTEAIKTHADLTKAALQAQQEAQQPGSTEQPADNTVGPIPAGPLGAPFKGQGNI